MDCQLRAFETDRRTQRHYAKIHTFDYITYSPFSELGKETASHAAGGL
jgi:hypothetical protein